MILSFKYLIFYFNNEYFILFLKINKSINLTAYLTSTDISIQRLKEGNNLVDLIFHLNNSCRNVINFIFKNYFYLFDFFSLSLISVIYLFADVLLDVFHLILQLSWSSLPLLLNGVLTVKSDAIVSNAEEVLRVSCFFLPRH